MTRQPKYAFPILSLALLAGCGDGGGGIVKTGTADPTAVYLPIVGQGGLSVISAKAPTAAPVQIDSSNIDPIALQTQYTTDPQGTVSAGDPDRLFYATQQASGGDHVWSLKLSGVSRLGATQLSSLTIPYFAPPARGWGQFCGNQLIQKNLADPDSGILLLALPDETTLCSKSEWLLIHAADSPATDPVRLTGMDRPILPLYRPNGLLAGLVTVDAANNLNFYPDETFTNPKLLLANVTTFESAQEPPAAAHSPVASNPTYSFLFVRAVNDLSGNEAVYRIDYTGALSPQLYADSGSSGCVVNSNTLYCVEPTVSATTENVIQIPGSGAPTQVLATASAQQASWLPALQGLSGNNLVFTAVTPQQQWLVQTLPAGAPGTFTTIASQPGVISVSLAAGDIFVTWAVVSTGTEVNFYYSTEVLDSTGNILQPLLPLSSFVSADTPVLVKNISDSGNMGGGGLYGFDLSQPSSPVVTALKTDAGGPFTLPSNIDGVYFRTATPTISVADSLPSAGAVTNRALIYDHTTGVVTPVSLPNSTLRFVTGVDTPTRVF